MTRKPQTKASPREAELLLASGRVREAESHARDCLADRQDTAEATLLMARCAVARGAMAEALRWADRANRLLPHDESTIALYAALLLSRGEARLAVRALDRALPHLSQPLRPDTVLTHVHALLNAGDAGRAAETVLPVLQAATAYAPLAGRLAGAVVRETGRAGWISIGTTPYTIQGGVRLDLSADVCVRLTADGIERLSLPLGEFLDRYGIAAPGDAERAFALPVTGDSGNETPQDIILQVGKQPLFGSPVRTGPPPAVIEGVADIQGSMVLGWVRYPHQPDASVEVTIRDAEGNEARTTTGASPPNSFRLDLTGTGLIHGPLRVEAGSGHPLIGSPVRWIDWSPIVRARAGNAGTVAGLSSALPWIPVPVGGRPQRSVPPAPPRTRFDIIVPVYRGLRETMDCLRSVAITTQGAPCSVIVINDASPEPALTAWLRDFTRETGMTLLENPENLGFPGTVNRGLGLHPDHDVLILNADTIVAGDWWRRLRAAAYADGDVGTVTPMSNDATILSYPSPKADDAPAMADEIPTAEETAALDHHAATANAGQTVDIPTGIGFCLYIRRDCLDETGLLNVDAFAQGYGEENDFCLRARHLGWRHLAATDVFVAHVGGRSFGQRKTLLLARNLVVLNRLHPGYNALIERFIADDPLAPARRRLDLARWQSDGRPTVLLITLDLDGGVARHVKERIAALHQAGTTALVLYPVPSKTDAPPRCRLEDSRQPGLRDLVLSMSDDADTLLGLLRSAGVDRVEIHHTLNHDPAVLTLPRRLGVPYDMVIHDYNWLCPRITLIDGSNRYCHEPPADACDRCVAAHGSRHGSRLSVAEFRQNAANLLLQARSIIAPSDDTAKRIKRYLPTAPVIVRPWDHTRPPMQTPARPAKERWTVCIVGAIGRHKGYDTIVDCARDAAHRNLPLDFTIVGYTEDDGPLLATGHVFITGPFDEEEANRLIVSQNADIGWLPAVWPETWSYTLSECWRAGLMVAVTDLGAPAERVRQYGGGFLLPLDISPPSINDTFLTLLSSGTYTAGFPGFRPRSVQPIS